MEASSGDDSIASDADFDVHKEDEKVVALDSSSRNCTSGNILIVIVLNYCASEFLVLIG